MCCARGRGASWLRVAEGSETRKGRDEAPACALPATQLLRRTACVPSCLPHRVALYVLRR